VVASLSDYRFFVFTCGENNYEKSCQCLAALVTQVTGSRQRKQSKKASSFYKMYASPWYYIRNQVIEENANFYILPSQNVQGYTSVR
jgi:hypothetical protein